MSDSIKMMNVDQAREYMERHKPDDYTLLDVRQNWEYEELHIPGARLIPLGELMDRLEELPPEKPIIAQCASGGRSMAAATLLEGQGFEDITNMVGGIMAWEGHVAFGPMELGMIDFSGTETPEEVVLKAYAMEQGLRAFYLLRADMAETPERVEVFMELAGYEDRHMSTLVNLYERITGQKPDAEAMAEMAAETGVVSSEGGVKIQEFIDEYADAFRGDLGVLEVAAMVEAQALDYYLRCADRAQSQETAEVLQLLAREEKAHLKLVGRQLDKGGDVPV